MQNKDSSVIAVHACGFSSPYTVCTTFCLRLEKATDLIKEMGPRNIMISGGVKYSVKYSYLLCHIGGVELKGILRSKHKIQDDLALYASDCYNSSTDIQDFLRIAEEQGSHKIIVISSYWHHWALRPLYAYWIEKLEVGMAVKFVSPDHDCAGMKTKCFYLVYGFLIKLFLMVGLFGVFDRLINKLHSQRRINGYPVSGCD